jgi:DNA (cytosine-5)-methyltransferase 1
MRYGSVCSGIEAASCAWRPLGWRAAFVSEIEAFPRAVLQHHYPDVPLHGDFTTIRAGEYEPIQLLVGGTPCQSFSVAGLRGGLDDERGNLALEYLRLADRLRPRWLVWENVPGVLSSNGGRDFGSILGGLVELGYGFAYRVLDAQFFGVAQRRRRVFVVGHLGDWRRAAAVLFERHSLQGHPAPRREAGESLAVAPTLRAGGNRTGGDRPPGTDVDTCDSLIAYQATGDAFWREGLGPLAVSDDNGTNQLIAHALRGEGFDASEDGTGRGTPLVPVAFGWQNSASQGDSVSEHITPSLDKSKTPAVAFALRGREGGAMPEVHEKISALRASSGGSTRDYVAESAVRRLTPVECERLQGFPDDYTLISYRGKPAADGPRYKALGNSMAVPVMAWIGRRIEAVDALQSLDEAA